MDFPRPLRNSISFAADSRIGQRLSFDIFNDEIILETGCKNLKSVLLGGLSWTKKRFRKK